MIKRFTLSLLAGVALCASAATANAPTILLPGVQGGSVIRGLSANGNYGVAEKSDDESGTYFPQGAFLYDLTGSTIKSTNLSSGTFCSAKDVTNDGKTVVGSWSGASVGGNAFAKPAICRNIDGKWTWRALPLPSILRITVIDLAYDTPKQISINGGHVNAVTPDGKYAVGALESSDYYLFERGAMWDISDPDNPKIIEVNLPNGDIYGNGNTQSRIMDVSDDGRYLLCWNYFSMEGYIYIFDRETDEVICIDRKQNEDGTYSARIPGYGGAEAEGYSNNTLTGDGRYFAGGITDIESEMVYPFLFDVHNRKLEVYNDGVHENIPAWSVTKDGMVLAANEGLYSDGYAYYDNFFFDFAKLYKEVYQMNMGTYNIDNTGKPTLVSADGRTVVFVTGQHTSYVAKFKEDLKDGFARIDLMSNWAPIPASGSKMSAISTVSFKFDNPVECDPSQYADVVVKDSQGNVVATALPNGGVVSEGFQLTANFRVRNTLTEGEKYTVTLPAGICWVKGRPQNKNKELTVTYVGRGDAAVVPKSISPEPGTTQSLLDLNENPIQIVFDAPVKVNGTADNRPTATLYIDDNTEAAGYLALDVDLNTNSLIVYPMSKIFLYKGSTYTVKIPEGAVTDLSGFGPSAAIEISYEGAYQPEVGDEVYLFKSNCDDFTGLLFYEGDHGTPVEEFANMGFNADEYPWWVVMDEDVEDMALASHSCYVDGRKSNDWFAIRALNIPEDIHTYLSFQGQSYRKNKQDRLQIYVYENVRMINQLTEAIINDIRSNGDKVFDEQLDPGATEGRLQGEWTDYVVDLADYAGKTIYIAFANENQNQSMVMVDNIRVVKEVNAFLTITSNVNVVDQESAEVKGILTVFNDLASYDKLSMTLKDAEGKDVSTITANVDLKGGDTYNFTFPEKLPLVVGEPNGYVIEYTLGDDDPLYYNGIIRNLAFAPVKRVIVEECTGKTCSNCPLGILGMENLEKRFNDQVIPICLHAYGNGADPKGINMIDYTIKVFDNNLSAPNGRINRRPNQSAPMYSADINGTTTFHYTMNDIPGASPVWQDEVVEELAEPSYLAIALTPKVASAGKVAYTVTVKPAINLEDQSIRLLGVLLEDGLVDSQINGMSVYSDPALGEFGKGGIFGGASFYYTFNNVARGYWGQSYNGTGNLFPRTLETGKEYSVDVEMNIPSIVEKPENLKMVFILIDESTGRVINAISSASDISGVEDVADDLAGSIEVYKNGSEVVVAAPDRVEAVVYALDGRVLGSAAGFGNVTLRIDGYKGVAIVRAVSDGKAVTKKIVL